jgi:Na+-transporting methylmalonyl-CoA/oxaloacetate decarboxylase gamma subunit
MNNIGWGLQISALGMGLVFGLLALLWGLLTLVLKFDAPPAAAPEPEAEVAIAPAIDPAVVAAITVAVLAHGANRRAEAAPQMRIHWPGSLLHASRWVAAGRTRQNHSWQRGRR